MAPLAGREAFFFIHHLQTGLQVLLFERLLFQSSRSYRF